ncbi:MAG: thiamine phosphate synthase [Proteobacteria bacterium]|nr:thiamine phosphate synthase [Pseudomonadota bacterium]HQR03832.1 thiamine phosphate synthase [Rhodocyclaceae bacterium]
MRAEDRSTLRGLYAVTADDYLLPRLSVLVSMALRGGARLVQYRNKTAPKPLRRSQAAELLRICRAEGARLIVNDDLDMALEIGADGVHLGRDDIPGGDLAATRAALGPDRILGVSCYNELARGEVAAAAGADYLAFGSVFPSITKPGAASAPLSLLGEARSRFGLPVAAIGGISLANAPAVITAGADMVAVISELFDAMDIAARAEQFHNLFLQHRT